MNLKIKKLTSHSIPIPTLPVMAVDDEYAILELVRYPLKQLGLDCVTFLNPIEASLSLGPNKYCLYIVDQNMPEMEGYDLIKKIQEQDEQAIIIVITGSESKELAVDTMRLHIYDYLFKPVNLETFTKKVLEALEYRYIRDMEASVERTTSTEVSKLLEWLIYKNKVEGKQARELHTNTIRSLTTFLNEDWGVGALVKSVHELKDAMAELSIETCQEVKPQLEKIFNINQEIENLTEGLTYMNFAVGESLNLMDWDSENLDGVIEPIIENLKPFVAEKNIPIVFSPSIKKCKLKVEMDVLIMAIEEIIINACKYSIPNTTIHVYSTVADNFYWLVVLNSVNSKGKISPEQEEIVKEPFFRLQMSDISLSGIEKFGLGLGLTAVNYISQKHNGDFKISTVKDYITKEPKDSIMARIMLPLF
jgi:DNA-binding response OmpR family regulator